MECIFLNAAGQALFVRDDMESGHWVQQEMNVTADFPYNPDKVIETGQRIAFRNPATDVIEVFEILNAVNHGAEGYQQITAEHICIAELSDEHINNTDIEEKTAAQALTTALSGTLWEVGNNTASGERTAKFSRGNVWNAIGTIQQYWDVYITPRVTISSAGAITHRYLDIAPAEGTWRGLRLSVSKNLIDPAVTYDEANVYTAVYGYGGNVDVPQATGDDVTEELTFADEVWTATSDHPAKPAGQTYLEWPEKTALYGRNGRPRFGYYQNADITDAGELLEATWISLQRCCEPKVTVSGTCVDLYRLGYHDEPLQLHDMALIEIEETGELIWKQLICLDVDLVNPSEDTVEIGDYIPSIVYINHETNEETTGPGNGGRTPGGDTNAGNSNQNALHTLHDNMNMTKMVVGKKNGVNYIRRQEITDAVYPNDKDHDGLVKKGDGQNTKVWATDNQGNPDWRDPPAASVSDNDPTLAWSTRSKVGTVAGTDLHVTMPANPDTWRPVQDNLTSTSIIDALTANQGRVLNSNLLKLARNSVAEISDCNDAKETGIYNAGASAANRPPVDYCVLYVFATAYGSTLAQFALSQTSSRAFIRSYANNQWSAWQELALNSSLANKVDKNSQASLKAIELSPKYSTAGHGGYIDFHHNDSSADFTSRIIDSGGELIFYVNSAAKTFKLKNTGYVEDGNSRQLIGTIGESNQKLAYIYRYGNSIYFHTTDGHEGYVPVTWIS